MFRYVQMALGKKIINMPSNINFFKFFFPRNDNVIIHIGIKLMNNLSHKPRYIQNSGFPTLLLNDFLYPYGPKKI